MRINHNIAALNTHRQLAFNNLGASKSLEKLSSGFRINRAGDDAAGLAISEKMRGQIRGLDQAVRNSQDGISLIQTAEGALNETHSILQRMKELATQAANDTNTLDDRKEIQKEINQLTSEINRIGNTTEFNTQKVLNGGVQTNLVTVNPQAPAGGITAADPIPGVAPSGTNATATLVQQGLTITGGGNGTDYNDFVVTVADVGAGNAETIAIDYGNGTITLNLDLAATTDIATITSLTETGTVPAGGSFSFSGIVSSSVTAGTLGTTSGGSTANSGTQGVSSFTIDTALAAGESFQVAGRTITVYGDAAALSASGDTNGIVVDTADNQAQAIRTLFAGGDYTVTGAGATVTLTQTTAGTGNVAAASPVSVPGSFNFSVDTDSMVAAGGSYRIDNQEILVVEDATEYAAQITAGTAILVGTDAATQAENLMNAINRNAELTADTAVTGQTGNYTATRNGAEITLTQSTPSATAPTVRTAEVAGATGEFSATLQIGANQNQSLRITIADMRSFVLGISSTTAASGTTGVENALFTRGDENQLTDVSTQDTAEYALDVSTHESASAAITVLDQAIKAVSAERSKLGAVQNRLEHTINNLGAASENLTAAESRIRDVDMAKEMMEFTKNNILTQAAQAMLAQANQQPQGVLQLLR